MMDNEIENFIKEMRNRKVVKMDIDTFIKEHKHINYCEAIVDYDGLIGYAVPSHSIALIKESGHTEEELEKIIPVDADWLNALVNVSRCCAIWFNGCVVPVLCSDVQIEVINKLVKAKIVNFKEVEKINPLLAEISLDIKKVKFEDCCEGYDIRTDGGFCRIAVNDTSVIMSVIFSHKKGEATNILKGLEKYAKSINKNMVVSNCINEKIERIVKERGYSPEYVPFSEEHLIDDVVEIYVKEYEKL